MTADGRDERTKRFVSTTVEVEGREETKIVELPAFDPAPWGDDAALSIVGTRQPRADALEKVTGHARYTADTQRAGMVHAVLVRSTIPRGTATVHVAAARDMPGVLGVLTAADVATALGAPASRLFDATITYTGQPIAAICAESTDLARRAAALVRVDYAPAPFAVTFQDAMASDAPRVRGGTTNLALKSPLVEQRGNVEQGLRDAQVTISATFRTPVALHTALEPHGAVAEWEGDRLTVWESTQGVFRVRNNLAQAFKLPHTHVRVLCDFMGGGFGAKAYAGAHTYAAALFARQLRLPVRCVLDREGEQMDTGNRPASVQRVTLAATNDGRLTAIICEADVPLGINGWEGGPAAIYHQMYSCPNVKTTETFAWINASAMQAFRGPGHVEGAFGLERAMDMLARKLAMDPLELRRANFAATDEQKSRPWSSNALLACYTQGAERFGWTWNPSATSQPAPVSLRPVRRGIGLAAQAWPSGGGPPAYALCRINSDGTASVLAGTQDLGTGSRTVLAQVAAEALGMHASAVRCVIGDTERLPYTGTSWGSMTTPSVAPAVRMAAEDARATVFEAAAEMLDVPATTLSSCDGVISSTATGETMTFAGVARKLGEVMIIGRGSRGPNPQKMGIYSFGVQFAEVEVDVETGVVRVLRIVAAHDAGRILNPTLAESQLEGGIIQGLGYALFEERAMDVRTGVPLNPTMHDYKIPTMADIPRIDAFCVNVVDATANHVGARGLAEPPIIPTAPAIANAVANALGVDVTKLPLTPWRVLGALAGRAAD